MTSSVASAITSSASSPVTRRWRAARIAAAGCRGYVSTSREFETLQVDNGILQKGREAVEMGRIHPGVGAMGKRAVAAQDSLTKTRPNL